MDRFLTALPWQRFFYFLLLLGLGYLILWFIPMLVRLLVQPGRNRVRWLQFLEDVRVIYQPVALILAIILIVFVNPLPHGLLVAGFVVLGWGPLRNFVGGRLLQATSHLSKGQEITIGDESGTIQSLEPLSLLLQTDDGTRVIPYQELQQTGFTIRRGTRISGMREFSLQPVTDAAAEFSYLRDHLFICPYLDWGTEPEIVPADGETPGFRVRLLMEDEKYWPGMQALVKEWGYTLKV